MNLTNLSIKEILELIENADPVQKTEIIDAMKRDERQGVKKALEKVAKKEEQERKEIDRILKMKAYEYKYIEKGAKYIAGIDEVGRGPLAGPVYAAAVILPVDCVIMGINDSKKLSPQKRSQLYDEIRQKAVSYSIGYCDEKIIDDINILNATYKAMKQAIEGLCIKPQVLLVDAVRIPGIDIFQVPIIRGDSASVSIAAASIIAKVERDSVMDLYHEKYPVYNFRSNKGYGTQEHIEAIRSEGPCSIHRRTFIGSFI